MEKAASVSTWLEELKKGNEEVGVSLWNRYVTRLVELAGRKLKGTPRRASDEEDLALTAFNALLMGVRENRFHSLNSRNDLWQLLIMLTERRAVDQIRHEAADKRGGGGVLGESALKNPDSGYFGIDSVSEAEPSEEFAQFFAEEVEENLNKLQDQELERIVVLKLSGFNNRQVANEIGRSLSTVDRKLDRIQRIWSAHLN